MMSRYGGGNRRGTLLPANDIYLKRIGEKITLKEVLDNTEREAIYTKEWHTMWQPRCFLIKENCVFQNIWMMK